MIDDNERETRLENLIRGAAPAAFSAGFEDRVLRRLHADAEIPLSAALERQFKRIVPVAIAASLLFAAYNWWGAHGSGRSAIEAALNLPQVSIASAYTFSTDLGGTSGTENP